MGTNRDSWFVPSLSEQIERMRRSFPGFNLTRIGGGAIWTGAITPRPMCDTYQIRIVYHPTIVPVVRVLGPELRRIVEWERIPHVYRDGSLCLFWPKAEEWRPWMSIDSTIIPWAARWLFHYEIWHATGDWEGGGEHPESGGDSNA